MMWCHLSHLIIRSLLDVWRILKITLASYDIPTIGDTVKFDYLDSAQVTALRQIKWARHACLSFGSFFFLLFVIVLCASCSLHFSTKNRICLIVSSFTFCFSHVTFFVFVEVYYKRNIAEQYFYTLASHMRLIFMAEMCSADVSCETHHFLVAIELRELSTNFLDWKIHPWRQHVHLAATVDWLAHENCAYDHSSLSVASAACLQSSHLLCLHQKTNVP